MSIKEQLVAMGPEKLADLLIEFSASHKVIKKQLNTVIAGQNQDPKKLLSIINRELNTLKKAKGMIFYDGVKAFAERLDQLRISIVKELANKSAEAAVQAMGAFLDLSKHTLERADDSYGYVGDVFSNAAKDWGNLYARTNPTTEVCVDDVFGRFVNDDYGLFSHIILDFKEALEEPGLVLLQQKLRQGLSPKKSYKLQSGLKDIADCQKNVDAYIEACLIDGKPGFGEALEIAKRLLEQWRTEEAQEWIKKAEQHMGPNRSVHSQWAKELSVIKTQALELSGQYDAANQERMALFKQTLDTSVYEDVLRHISPELQTSFKAEALQTAFNFYETSQALRFLDDIHEEEAISRFIRHRRSELNGRDYTVLRAIAKKVADKDPLGAILVYRILLAAIMVPSVSKYYVYAVKDLKSINALNDRVKDWEGHTGPVAYFKALEIQHKKKYSFWDLYKAK